MFIRLSGTGLLVVSTLLFAPMGNSAVATPATFSTGAFAAMSVAASAQEGTKAKVRAIRSASMKIPRRAPGPRHMGAVKLRVNDQSQMAYKLDPNRRKPKSVSAVSAQSVVDASTGSKTTRSGTVAATARAAYLISEYGAYRKSRAQGAALELALNHLLQSKAWGVKGKKTAKRLQSSRLRLVVRKYARVMLAEARASAGPYVVTVTGERVSAGQPTTLHATVTSAAGKPMKGLDVDFTVAGAPAGVGTTTEAGTASARYTTNASGVQPIAATVPGLPDSQMRIVTATRPRKATRLAVMGTAAPVQASGSLLAVATPVLGLVPPAQQLAGVGVPFAGAVRLEQIAPGGSPLAASVALHGPFTTAAGAAQACQSGEKAAGSVTGTIPATPGLQQLPGGLTVPTEGYYAYRVKIAGNEVNNPAEACGGAMRAMRQPTIKITQEPGPIVCGGSTPCGRYVTVIFDIANLPLGYQGTLRVDHYEYVGAPDCVTPPEGSSGRIIENIAIGENGNGRYTFTFRAYAANPPEIHETIAALSPHDWMLPTSTACGAARYTWS